MIDLAVEQRRQVIAATKNDAVSVAHAALKGNAPVGEILDILQEAVNKLTRLGENVNDEVTIQEVEAWRSKMV